MENRNVFLLAMSTLGLIKNEDKKMVLPKYRYLNDETDKNPKEYYSQLEPVSKMIIGSGVIPDQIIVLCTKESLRKELFYLEDDLEQELCYSAYDFYKARIAEVLPSDKKSIFVNIDIDASNINIGIKSAANLIITKKAEIESESKNDEKLKIKLWIDTQGGFRDISLVMNAIMNLLKIHKITTAGIYSIQFNRVSNPQSIIKDQTRNYSVFDFVSGMNEFIMYGRAEQLSEYYAEDCSDMIKNIVKAMKNVSDEIQMCDPTRFLECLQELRNVIIKYEKQETDNSDELFTIFIYEVKSDYGVLLQEDNCTNIDIIDWFFRKQFYQQALTFIESKIPSEIIEKGLIEFKYSIKKIRNFKEAAKKSYEKDMNYILFHFLKPISSFNIHHIVNRQANSFLGIQNEGEILKTVDTLCDKKDFLCNSSEQYKVHIKEKIMESNDTIAIVDIDRKNMLRTFLFLFSILKKERNNFNHMSEKANSRATKEELDKVISLFTKTGRSLYYNLNIRI